MIRDFMISRWEPVAGDFSIERSWTWRRWRVFRLERVFACRPNPIRVASFSTKEAALAEARRLDDLRRRAAG